MPLVAPVIRIGTRRHGKAGSVTRMARRASLIEASVPSEVRRNSRMMAQPCGPSGLDLDDAAGNLDRLANRDRGQEAGRERR